jgi:hypothetical protein
MYKLAVWFGDLRFKEVKTYQVAQVSALVLDHCAEKCDKTRHRVMVLRYARGQMLPPESRGLL